MPSYPAHPPPGPWLADAWRYGSRGDPPMPWCTRMTSGIVRYYPTRAAASAAAAKNPNLYVQWRDARPAAVSTRDPMVRVRRILRTYKGWRPRPDQLQ